MTQITYDPEADAVYIAVGRGKVDRTEETGPFIYDVDAEGHIVGIEILSASKVLAPGGWKKANPPGYARQCGGVANRDPLDLTLISTIRAFWRKSRRESAILSRHPENAAIDEWIEAVYDWSAWKCLAR